MVFSSTLPDQHFEVGVPVNLALPGTTGGRPPITYTVTPELPPGLSVYDAQILGAPTAASDTQQYTLTARDADGNSATQRIPHYRER